VVDSRVSNGKMLGNGKYKGKHTTTNSFLSLSGTPTPYRFLLPYMSSPVIVREN